MYRYLYSSPFCLVIRAASHVRFTKEAFLSERMNTNDQSPIVDHV